MAERTKGAFVVKEIAHIGGQPESPIITGRVDRRDARHGIRAGSLKESIFINRLAAVDELNAAAGYKDPRIGDVALRGLQNIESTGRDRLVILKERLMTSRRAGREMKNEIGALCLNQVFHCLEIGDVNRVHLTGARPLNDGMALAGE